MTLHVEPRVSVVIPTFNRPRFVRDAVQSALAQTLRAIEVIVVVDGRDAPTIQILEAIDDPRLRLIVPDRHLGNADARNVGVVRARSGWIAFLDDDDSWMPTKLAAQLEAAERSARRYPLVSCRVIGRNELEDAVWPRRDPRPGEPLGDYLFCRRTPFMGEGLLQTSTIFTARELLERVPFTSGMRRFVDLDWLLRVTAEHGVEVEFVAEREPLAIWNMERDRLRISNGADTAYALSWAREHRHLLTRRAYAAFLMTLASASAIGGGDRRAFLPLALEACRHGRASAIDVMTHVANFTLPRALVRSAVWRQLRAAAAARLA